MATHSSVLVWRVPGTGEPGGLPSLGSHRVGHAEATQQQQRSPSYRSASDGCAFWLHFLLSLSLLLFTPRETAAPATE